jgi:hypothetical protein
MDGNGIFQAEAAPGPPQAKEPPQGKIGSGTGQHKTAQDSARPLQAAVTTWEGKGQDAAGPDEEAGAGGPILLQNFRPRPGCATSTLQTRHIVIGFVRLKSVFDIANAANPINGVN